MTNITPEQSPYYNLLGALIDIKRQWKDADPVCLETIERVLEQIKQHSTQKAFDTSCKKGVRSCNNPTCPVCAQPIQPLKEGELHIDTIKLVDDFAAALKAKLLKAQIKYGYGNTWKYDDWKEKCQADLAKHVMKGDPLDVASYCAFMWFHGWSTLLDKEINYAPVDPYLTRAAPQPAPPPTGMNRDHDYEKYAEKLQTQIMDAIGFDESSYDADAAKDILHAALISAHLKGFDEGMAYMASRAPDASGDVAKQYWIMGCNVYHAPTSKISADAQLICECKTVEQAHAIRDEIIKQASTPNAASAPKDIEENT